MEESVGVGFGNAALGAGVNFSGLEEIVQNQLVRQSRLLGTLRTMLFFDPTRLAKSWSVYGRQW
jgi:hypothetical protein